ncbi:MAG: CRTAC1 family protein [Deltaproteobacteria bacterium]|nr:CRTAC1 family protein [Deltaproteobacteria bacterium]
MSWFRAGKGLSRKGKVWLAVWFTVLGTAGLTLFALWVEARRKTDLADPTAGVTAQFKGSGTSAAPPIKFHEVAQAMGVVMQHGSGQRGRTLPEDTGSGIAWGDYDGDGDWDLYVVNFPGPLHGPPDPTATNHLYRNDGDRFTDVTDAAGVGDPDGFGMGATFADYDADGRLDLHVTNYGPNRLFHNRGDGTFEQVAEKAGVADPLWSAGAAWGDFDRDGHLDLYVCNYVRYDDTGIGPEVTLPRGGGNYAVPFTLNPNSFDPVPNRLYRNRGDGTFEDVAEKLGVTSPEGRSLNASFVDLDGDGWLDLYVNNDVSENKLFRNMIGDMGGKDLVAFADLSTMTGTADPRASMGLSVGEINEMGGKADGLPDMFLTHWVAQENAFYQSIITSGGDLEYRDKTRQYGLGEISIETVGWGSGLMDLDLDGWIDVVVANGSTLEHKENPQQLIAEPMFVFWNDGKQFHNVAATAGETLAASHDARGLAAADYDDDGKVDLAVAINRGQPMLLHNETETANRGLTVTLKGRPSECFGAKVEVVVNGRRQYRWWGADVTFLGMHAAEMIFGLGRSEAAEEVHVKWADGKETTLTNVPAGKVRVVHPSPSSPGRGQG